MSSNTTLSGRRGVVGLGPANTTQVVLVARVTKWKINPSLVEVAEWADSDTAGYIARAPGAEDAVFSTEGKYDTITPVWNLFQPRDKLFVQLWLTSLAPLFWKFPSALCISFSLMVDIDTEEVIGWSAEWGADGKFYKPGEV